MTMIFAVERKEEKMADLKLIAERCIPEECKDDLVSRREVYRLKLMSVTDWDFGQALINLPSVEPEIIRCGDCKWKQGAECVRFAEVRPFPDDFCSRAERRTDK